ncbi:alpha-amylase family glycosyl hydrolase, partial [Priestia megaterium]|uniref:alpha-amylase family glycosyl hydrolase n=1 Tax=Priestia megaterium TaxID=1404 RepID=UPI002FFD9565
MEIIKKRLQFIYENENIDLLLSKVEESIINTKAKNLKKRKQNWDEKDVVLITYGDQFYVKNELTLKTFKKMYEQYLNEQFPMVHILPFYPYSSDDGFSVIDYKKVNPHMGDWNEISDLTSSARLMFDDVCNHISAKSEWFQEYLKGNPKYKNFFIEMDPKHDLSAVTRPRATPV